MPLTPKLAATRVHRSLCSQPLNISFNNWLRRLQRDTSGLQCKDCVMWYRILDIIADRDLIAIGRIVAVAALVGAAALVGWFVIAF
jgi:hypothetical protein